MANPINIDEAIIGKLWIWQCSVSCTYTEDTSYLVLKKLVKNAGLDGFFIKYNKIEWTLIISFTIADLKNSSCNVFSVTKACQ